MTYDIGLLLDGLILVFLSVTIFYAARLSLFMKTFRQSREGLQTLIRDLSVTINKAENSIEVMKQHAQVSEQELRDIVNEAKFLSDELRFMNSTGDSLANRLEKLADRNRELVDLMENAGGIGTQKITPFDAEHRVAEKVDTRQDEEVFEISDFDFEFDLDEDDEKDFMALGDGAYRDEEVSDHKSRVDTQSKSKVRSFAIFDRDYVAGLEDEEELDQDEVPSQFQSKAEQDLYEALQRKQRPTKRVSEIS